MRMSIRAMVLWSIITGNIFSGLVFIIGANSRFGDKFYQPAAALTTWTGYPWQTWGSVVLIAALWVLVNLQAYRAVFGLWFLGFWWLFWSGLFVVGALYSGHGGFAIGPMFIAATAHFAIARRQANEVD